MRPYRYQHPAPPGARNARRTRLITVAELPVNLARLVTQFQIREAGSRLKKSRGSFLRCGTATDAFVAFLEVHGIRAAFFDFNTVYSTFETPAEEGGAGLEESWTTTEYPEFYGEPSENHGGGRTDHVVAIVESGDPRHPYFFDWTARQFSPRAPFPLIWTERFDPEGLLR